MYVIHFYITSIIWLFGETTVSVSIYKYICIFQFVAYLTTVSLTLTVGPDYFYEPLQRLYSYTCFYPRRHSFGGQLTRKTRLMGRETSNKSVWQSPRGTARSVNNQTIGGGVLYVGLRVNSPHEKRLSKSEFPNQHLLLVFVFTGVALPGTESDWQELW